MMINVGQYDKLLEREDACYWRDSRRFKDNKSRARLNHQNTRLKLFWDFRYQFGSYKARKAGIGHPSVMMRYDKDKFRLYGEPENNKLFAHAKDILASWKAKSRAEMKALLPQYRQWLKENRLRAKDNPFWYWNVEIRLAHKP